MTKNRVNCSKTFLTTLCSIQCWKTVAIVFIVIFGTSGALSEAPGETGWAPWKAWTTGCSALCGINVQGSRIRFRDCVGQPCLGETFVIEDLICNVSLCSDPGLTGWASWGPWTIECAAPCGINVQGSRVRFQGCLRRPCLDETYVIDSFICNVPPCSECTGQFVSYIVTDGSESLSADGFALVKQALMNVSSEVFNKNPANRIGIVVYSDDVTEVISATSDAIALQQQIANVFYPSSGTRTDLGIKRGRELLLEDTEPVPKVLVVVTDGLSNLPIKTQEEANITKESGISVLSVGVTQRVRFVSSIFTLYTQELRNIASDENSTYALETFHNLMNNAGQWKQCDTLVNGAWGLWAAWTEVRCYTSCGDNLVGLQNRVRECNSPVPDFNGQDCVGISTESRDWPCQTQTRCPVDGQWVKWNTWITKCTATCGPGSVLGYRTRERECTLPAPRFGGKECLGEKYDTSTTQCTVPQCIVDGGWSRWADWTSQGCSEPCGLGVEARRRIRTCTDPTPSVGGAFCLGPDFESFTIECFFRDCAVHGNWGTWIEIPGDCSTTCGPGTRRVKLVRVCVNPVPSNGGLPCIGSKVNDMSRDCNERLCPEPISVTTIAAVCACVLSVIAIVVAGIVCCMKRRNANPVHQNTEHNENTDTHDEMQLDEFQNTVRNSYAGLRYDYGVENNYSQLGEH